MNKQDLVLMKKVVGILLSNVHLLAKLEIDAKDVRGLYIRLFNLTKVKE